MFSGFRRAERKHPFQQIQNILHDFLRTREYFNSR